uniref:Uncharacterized protein n=1 Tax=Amphimedon queenslandica TaxID=400682 RepID=A0A1X7UCY4_AMPQE
MEDKEEKHGLLDLSPSKAKRATEATEFLSSLPGPSGAGTKSTLPQSSSRQKATTSSSALSHSQSQTHIPVSESEKHQLQNAGLGSKDITLCLDASYDESQAEIIDAFPQLSDGGGYRSLKGTANSNLNTIV